MSDGDDDDRTDEELFAAWVEGDTAAGDTLFLRHYESIRWFFRNKVEDVDDFVQKTILALVENAARFRGDASFRTYLFAIARKVLLKHIRDKHGPRGKWDLGTVSMMDLGDSPSRIVADSEEKELLLLALRHLTVDQQTILELFYWEGMKVAEIAEVLERPVGTVKTQMRAARKRLRELVEELASSPRVRDQTLSKYVIGDPDDEPS